MTITVLVALLAAVCFAVASVLQHHGARNARRRPPLHPGLVAELARTRCWSAGVAAQAAGVTLHLLAVNLGPLSVVQPVLTFGLVVALLLERLSGRRSARRSLPAAGLVVCGLAAFLAVAPAGESGSTVSWAPGLTLAGLLVMAGLAAGFRTGGTVRCACLGASAGVLMATSAALGKAWGAVLGAEGVLGLAGSWQLWAALACGGCGTLLSLSAYQAGPLGGSLGAMTAIDPVMGVALGVLVFGEPFGAGAAVLVRLLGLGLTLAGVVLLAGRVSQRRGADGRVPVRPPASRPGHRAAHEFLTNR